MYFCSRSVCSARSTQLTANLKLKTQYFCASNFRTMNNFTPSAPKARGPAPTVICYLCGRQFGSKSISIHEPQCRIKWDKEQAKLPKSQRRPAPIKPAEVALTASGKVDYEAMNEASWQASQANMVQCEVCGRRFQPDRLPVHQKSCRPDNPAKAVKGK